MEAQRSDEAASLPKVLAGFLLLWLLLDRSAAFLGSLRGEAGIAIGVLVVGAAVLNEEFLFGRDTGDALSDLGLRKPSLPALLFALAASSCLLCFFPLYAAVANVEIGLAANWPWLALGIFAQGGLAEEVLFRGYLFRHLRRGRSFLGAAILSAVPFTLVHLTLFASVAWPIALASLLVALALSFPFAWLFERGGNSVWPPAILHAVIQGAIKLALFPPLELETSALWWMALSTVVPFFAFLLPAKK